MSIPEQVAVGGDVVDHLRQHPAPVDGVGGGQEVAPLGQLLPQLLVGEKLLHPRLGVVEVAVHRADPHVVSLLGDHLELLDGGDPVLGVEHQNFGVVHVPEALQGPLARVAGGGHQDAHRLLLLQLPQGGGEQVGQHLQGHVLEGAGGAVPQLQTEGVGVQGAHRGHRRGVELLRPVGGVGEVGELLDGEPVQEQLHHVHRPLLIGHVLQLLQGAAGQLGQIDRREQPSVVRQPLGDGLSGGKLLFPVSCADVLHLDSFHSCFRIRNQCGSYQDPLVLYYAIFSGTGQPQASQFASQAAVFSQNAPSICRILGFLVPNPLGASTSITSNRGWRTAGCA